MKERGINMKRKIVFLLLSYLIAAEKAELRTTGASKIHSGLARIEFSSEDLSAKRAFIDTIETLNSRRPPVGSRFKREDPPKIYAATAEEKRDSEDKYSTCLKDLPPAAQSALKATDEADVKWVETNHAKKLNASSPDNKEYEQARQKEQDTVKSVFESETDLSKLRRFLKAYKELRKGEPWPHQYDIPNRYPNETNDFHFHRQEELSFVQQLRDAFKTQYGGKQFVA